MINDNATFSQPCRKKNSLVNKASDEEFIKIIQESDTWKEIGKRLGYNSKVLSPNIKDSITERCSKLGMEPNIKVVDSILDRTKGELFKSRKNWQSARSTIRRHAQQVFKENNPNPKCAICGYQHHVEVAHIKAVSDFDNDATIREINSIDNLIGLCPNHHWEFDNGILKDITRESFVQVEPPQQ